MVQFMAMAVELGWVSGDETPELLRRTVVKTLHDRGRWLLVFDSAAHPADIAPWLPGGSGHVLITSSAHGWDDLAVPRPVGVFTRAESRALLQSTAERDGTRRRYGLKVPAHVSDPVEAAAWTAGLGKDQYAQMARRT